jgi:hypothetical protein
MRAIALMGDASTTRGVAVRRDERAERRSDHWFYVGTACACVVTVFSGFAPSFYLRPSAAAPKLAPHVVAHGLIFTSWFLLFLVQTALVASGRTRLHRQLGIGAAGLAVLMLVSGTLMAIASARRGALPGDPLAFLLVMMVDLLAFAVFMAAGMYYRRRSEPHKRSMLLATVSLLPPAISRWPIAGTHPPITFAVVLVFVAAPLVHDLVARRRLEVVSLWGGLALLASGPLRFAIASTEAWHRVASWIIR